MTIRELASNSLSLDQPIQAATIARHPRNEMIQIALRPLVKDPRSGLQLNRERPLTRAVRRIHLDPAESRTSSLPRDDASSMGSPSPGMTISVQIEQTTKIDRSIARNDRLEGGPRRSKILRVDHRADSTPIPRIRNHRPLHSMRFLAGTALEVPTASTAGPIIPASSRSLREGLGCVKQGNRPLPHSIESRFHLILISRGFILDRLSPGARIYA